MPGDSGNLGPVLIAHRIRVPIAFLGPVATAFKTYEPTIPNGRARHLIDDDEEQLESGLWLRTKKWVSPLLGGAVTRDR
jgi:hypothetical protein